MKARRLFAAAALASFAMMAAAAPEWRAFAYLADGSVWSYRTGTVGRQVVGGAPSITAVVEHRAGVSSLTYLAAVTEAHCGRPRGDVSLLNMRTGQAIERAVFVADEPSIGNSIASALCAAIKAVRHE